METMIPAVEQVLQVVPGGKDTALRLSANRHALWRINGSLVWPVYGVEADPETDMSKPVLVEDFKSAKRMVLVVCKDGTCEIREVVRAENRLRLHPQGPSEGPEVVAIPQGGALSRWEYGHNEDRTESYVALPGHHVTNKDTDGKPFSFHMTFLAPSFEEAMATINEIKYG